MLPVVVLAVVFFAGGGWYFAGQIRSDGLVVKHPPVTYDLMVVSVADGRVTLREGPGRERDDNLRFTTRAA